MSGDIGCSWVPQSTREIRQLNVVELGVIMWNPRVRMDDALEMVKILPTFSIT